MDGTSRACFDRRGCRGERECISGQWTGCLVDPGTCPVAGDVDDRCFVQSGVSPTTTFNVGELESVSADEAIAFAAGRAPTWAPAPWTPTPDQTA